MGLTVGAADKLKTSQDISPLKHACRLLLRDLLGVLGYVRVGEMSVLGQTETSPNRNKQYDILCTAHSRRHFAIEDIELSEQGEDRYVCT